jgi:hypothetical protein
VKRVKEVQAYHHGGDLYRTLREYVNVEGNPVALLIERDIVASIHGPDEYPVLNVYEIELQEYLTYKDELEEWELYDQASSKRTRPTIDQHVLIASFRTDARGFNIVLIEPDNVEPRKDITPEPEPESPPRDVEIVFNADRSPVPLTLSQADFEALIKAMHDGAYACRVADRLDGGFVTLSLTHILAVVEDGPVEAGQDV